MIDKKNWFGLTNRELRPFSPPVQGRLTSEERKNEKDLGFYSNSDLLGRNGKNEKNTGKKLYANHPASIFNKKKGFLKFAVSIICT